MKYEGRNKALCRALSVMRAVQARGSVALSDRFVDELASRLEVHKRTVYRDLDALRVSGWLTVPANPIAHRKGRAA